MSRSHMSKEKKDTSRPLSEDRIKDLPIITAIHTDPHPPAVGELFKLTIDGFNFKSTLCLQVYHYFNSKGEPLFPCPGIRSEKYYAEIKDVKILSPNRIEAGSVLITSRPGSFYIVSFADKSGESISGKYLTVYSLSEARALRPILNKDVYETKELCKLVGLSAARFSELKATIKDFPEPDNPEGPLPFCYSNDKAEKVCIIVPKHRSENKRTPPLRVKKRRKSSKKK